MALCNAYGSNSNTSSIEAEEMLRVLQGMMEAQKHHTEMMCSGMMIALEQINVPRSPRARSISDFRHLHHAPFPSNFLHFHLVTFSIMVGPLEAKQ